VASGERLLGNWLSGDDEVAGRFDPAPLVVEATVGTDGADDAVGGRFAVGGFLDDVFEGGAEVTGALLEEVEGVGVPVDATAVREFEFVAEFVGAGPTKEAFLDCVAVGMPADAAAAFVLGNVDGAVDGGGLLESSRIERAVARRALVFAEFSRFDSRSFNFNFFAAGGLNWGEGFGFYGAVGLVWYVFLWSLSRYFYGCLG